MKRLLLLPLAAVACFAQFNELAVTDDGRLYFSTALTRGPEPGYSKIYRVNGDSSISLIAAGETDDPFGVLMVSPLTSGDGTITGYARAYPCRTGSCGLVGLPRTFFEFQGIDQPDNAFNTATISRNGKYLLTSSFDVRLRLYNLTTKERRDLPQFIGGAGSQAVANSGAVLLHETEFEGSLLYLPPTGELRIVPGTAHAGPGAISPNGDVIAYERRTATTIELVLTNPTGAPERILASVPKALQQPWPNYEFHFHQYFANDGALIYLQPDQANVAQPMLLSPGADPRQLLETKGIQNAVLSGNGQLAWLVTFDGQLLRVRTEDGVADEIIPASPQLQNRDYFGVPGSIIRFTGVGITPELQFSINDSKLPISELKPGSGAAQIPWEYEGQGTPAELIVRGSRSPFFFRSRLSVSQQPTVTFERVPFQSTLLAAHQDFRGVLTAQDPAVPGETIHIFARNLGPVDQTIATGKPSPASPPANITTPHACYILAIDPKGNPPKAEGIEVPFAGLTAGSVGVYHIDITIPATWNYPGLTSVYCTLDTGDNLYRGDVEVIPVAPKQ